MATTGNSINPYEVLLANKGYLKIDGIEMAELKELEIKLTPDTKEIPLMNSATKGEVNTSYKGAITFEINKVYSRFKPAILECAKSLKQFTFNLEATVYKPNSEGDEEETIYISNCWIKGDVNLFTLKSDNDFLSEKYEAGFKVENADFTETIDDEQNDWESTT
jgi:hypothetical protein